MRCNPRADCSDVELDSDDRWFTERVIAIWPLGWWPWSKPEDPPMIPSSLDSPRLFSTQMPG